MSIDQEKLKEKSAFDGCYVWTTDWKEEELSNQKLYQHYKKNSPFQLEIQNPKTLGLKWQSNGTAMFHVMASGWVNSTRAGRFWKYLEMQGKFQGTATPQVSNGHLNLQIASTQASLAVQFDRDYVKEFSPNTYLSSSIQKNIQSYLASGISYATDLPEFDLGPFGIAKFNGWKAAGQDLIAIPLKLVAK